MKRISQKIGLFGGSFDPIHKGHLKMAQILIEKELLDEVIFIPNKCSPHKKGKTITPIQIRIKMLEIALEKYRNFAYTDVEAQDDYNYTYDTLQTISSIFVDKQLFYIMGMDCLKNLHTWYKCNELIEEYDFIIFPRKNIQRLFYSDLIDFFKDKWSRKLEEVIIDEEIDDISSEKIRQDIQKTGKSLDIPPPVMDFIKNNKLYKT